MILIEFLFAPTVPSAPRPKNTAAHDVVGLDVELVVHGSDRCVTSSMMPTVKWFRGLAADRSS